MNTLSRPLQCPRHKRLVSAALLLFSHFSIILPPYIALVAVALQFPQLKTPPVPRNVSVLHMDEVLIDSDDATRS
jgi:hypothetical protein